MTNKKNRRHTTKHVALGLQPSLRGNVSRRLHGARYRLGLRGLPAQVPGNTVQSRQESGFDLHGLDRHTRCVYRHLFRRLPAEAAGTATKRRRAIRPRLKRHLPRVLRHAVLPGLR